MAKFIVANWSTVAGSLFFLFLKIYSPLFKRTGRCSDNEVTGKRPHSSIKITPFHMNFHALLNIFDILKFSHKINDKSC